MELAEGGGLNDIYEVLQTPFAEPQIAYIAAQVLKGIFLSPFQPLSLYLIIVLQPKLIALCKAQTHTQGERARGGEGE